MQVGAAALFVGFLITLFIVRNGRKG